jgi:hypothetical protein
MMKHNYFSFVLTTFFCVASLAQTDIKSVPTISISALVKHEKPGLVFKTHAYVVFVFKCPKCPANAQCKPCMSNNFVISEKPGIIQDYSKLDSKDMVVYTDNPITAQLGKKYEFKLSLRAVEFSSDKRTLWSADLISFSN